MGDVLHPADGALETFTALVVGYGGGQGVDRLLYTYDAENRLTGVSPATPQPGDARVLDTYDPLGRACSRGVPREHATGRTKGQPERVLHRTG